MAYTILAEELHLMRILSIQNFHSIIEDSPDVSQDTLLYQFYETYPTQTIFEQTEKRILCPINMYPVLHHILHQKHKDQTTNAAC